MKRMMAAVFALTLVMAVPAQPASAETTTFEFTEAVFNTCKDDLTVINGKETITTEVTRLSGGRFRYYFQDAQRGTGSGLTGKQYTYRDTFTDSFVEGLARCIPLQRLDYHP